MIHYDKVCENTTVTDDDDAVVYPARIPSYYDHFMRQGEEFMFMLNQCDALGLPYRYATLGTILDPVVYYYDDDGNQYTDYDEFSKAIGEENQQCHYQHTTTTSTT